MACLPLSLSLFFSLCLFLYCIIIPQQVKKRVAEGASDIDKKEWDNIGKFLRNSYATADDILEDACGRIQRFCAAVR